MPIALRSEVRTSAGGYPAFSLFAILFLAAGLPFLAVATSAPLLQKWFAQTGHPLANDPYFLYAASNGGSLLSLIAYPLLLEPEFTLAEQSNQWRMGYVALILLIGICAVLLWRSQPNSMGSPTVDSGSEDQSATAISLNLGRRMRWLLYAFIPSSLMLGVTTYITTDIAAFPLLWVIPLALYLLTFVFVFAKRRPLRIEWIGRILAVLTVPAIIALIVEANPRYLSTPQAVRWMHARRRQKSSPAEDPSQFGLSAEEQARVERLMAANSSLEPKA